ncbi:Hypothetical predicted protein [Cloeon dipterum]|uniref:Uncharacterized protein n=1 Tax=Cloeon dipterum TaxID=197152 RepID=A0A8S1DP66_9INSE|nr:Hypothetical predicted protein [Cloeon dipterum]
MSGKNKNEVQFMEPPPFCEAHFLKSDACQRHQVVTRRFFYNISSRFRGIVCVFAALSSNYPNSTKFKMSGNKSMLLSLKESAIDTIVTNIGSYRDLIKKKISPPMRKIVLDKVMERIEEIGEDQVWAALPYLDQHRTTESFSIRDFADILFCLNWKTGELSNGRVSMEEFLQYLIEFVPNLQQLEIDVPGSIHVKTIKLQPLVATDLLLKMENLTEVTINGFDIQFSGFVRVCKESRNLQSIKADNILVDVPKISMKKILEAIGSLFGYQYYVDFEFPKKIEITLKKTDAITPPLKLLKAVVTGDFLDLIPSSLAELCIHAGKTAEIQSEGDCILRNLRRLGGSLKLLLLNGIRPEMNLTFNYIFEHCRGLETLTIRNSWVTADGPIASFGKLTHFYLLDENSFCTARLDRILSAPLLQPADFLTNLGVLIWKNSFLVRRRKWFTTLLEFGLPVLLFTFYAVSSAKLNRCLLRTEKQFHRHFGLQIKQLRKIPEHERV